MARRTCEPHLLRRRRSHTSRTAGTSSTAQRRTAASCRCGAAHRESLRIQREPAGPDSSPPDLDLLPEVRRQEPPPRHKVDLPTTPPNASWKPQPHTSDGRTPTATKRHCHETHAAQAMRRGSRQLSADVSGEAHARSPPHGSETLRRSSPWPTSSPPHGSETLRRSSP